MTAPDKPMLRTLMGDRRTPPPIWLMRQAGRYLPEYRQIRASAGSFLDLCYTPELAAEVTLQPIRRFGFDAAIIFSDILVVPHALGQPVSFEEGTGPVLEPVESAEGLFGADDPRVADRLVPVFEALSKVAASLPAETTLLGFAGAPWTVATYMVEGGTTRNFDRSKLLAFSKPAVFQRLIDRLVDATSAYLVRQVDAGADAVQLFDTWAGVLPESAFQRWCVAPVREIVRRIKTDRPGTPVIGFPRGIGAAYESYAADTGVDAVSIDYGVSPAWARDHVQSRSCIQGNLDPVYLVAGGEALEAEVRGILAAFQAGRFVFNLGHGILPSTPPENVEHLVRLVRDGS